MVQGVIRTETPAFRRLEQEDSEFKAKLGDLVSLNPAQATEQYPISKNKTNKQKEVLKGLLQRTFTRPFNKPTPMIMVVVGWLPHVMLRC